MFEDYEARIPIMIWENCQVTLAVIPCQFFLRPVMQIQLRTNFSLTLNDSSAFKKVANIG